jgi:hypothetical protein
MPTLPPFLMAAAARYEEPVDFRREVAPILERHCIRCHQPANKKGEVSLVKRVIQLFMNGGTSPMNTYDYKPALAQLHGQMLGPKEKPEGFVSPAGAVMRSPFEFKQHRESGRWVSSVFPQQAKFVDDMAFLMAMTTKTNVHGPAS